MSAKDNPMPTPTDAERKIAEDCLVVYLDPYKHDNSVSVWRLETIDKIAAALASHREEQVKSHAAEIARIKTAYEIGSDRLSIELKAEITELKECLGKGLVVINYVQEVAQLDNHMDTDGFNLMKDWIATAQRLMGEWS